MGNHPSSEHHHHHRHHRNNETTSGPPPPKHMLWGCETAEEHYARIEEACGVSSTGAEGLRTLGLEYRMVHAVPCNCNAHADTDVESSLSDEAAVGDDVDDYQLGMDDDDDDDEEEGDYNVGYLHDHYEQPQGEEEQGEFMVPLGTPINEHIRKNQLYELYQLQVEGMEHVFSNDEESKSSAAPIHKSTSAVSLFSLATHHSLASSVTSESGNINTTPMEQQDARHAALHDTCALRLFHIPSNELVTEKNHQTFIAHGNMYDKVAQLCMEHAQQVMMQEGDLEWATVCSERNIRALVSRERWHGTNRRKQVLLVVTGKGQVGAGIFSRRLLMTSGLEPATALSFVREAQRRDMDIVALDPNAHGLPMAMSVVETSLERLLFQNIQEDDEIYVLAHSMGGSQLVRFLLDRTASTTGEQQQQQQVKVNGSHRNGIHHHHHHMNNGTSNDAINKDNDDKSDMYLRPIRAVAFTDSNHNINWVKKRQPALTDFLVGPRSLYIKSHKVHEDAKKLGETHHDCQYWKHRFGTIRTLWAGTNEHALTNHAARFHIWEHFDSFRQRQQQQQQTSE